MLSILFIIFKKVNAINNSTAKYGRAIDITEVDILLNQFLMKET